ncbi:sodium/hydrogen exchanger 3 isoform X2 [Amborella trichopoda]|uniref:sodium/hydrogen exchanger 3 isoform X2 n=1 Tax=Amborella trichopoda TaxID=13333 RepID=UPI0009BF9F02|nr:sodium/hydrogen exchanger 3 isoform X2 [Amborella trichopoda]|eukprot:XP_020523428.1 sodium/hydrogen exchanger 3 isoform X2 [Amborella trichopoda]
MASLVTHSLMGSSSNDADHNLVVPVSLFVAVLCVCIVLGHLLRERGWANESITALIIGCITGTVILMRSRGSNPHILRFDEDLFFIYLLPPIIFNAGFQIKKKRFFQNIVAIVLFGVVGVFISSTVISAGSWWLFPKLGLLGLRVRDYLALGAIFSSTDTVCSLQVLPEDVTPILHSMIFGEGVVNDATAVVLFRSVQKIAVSHVDGISAVRIANDFLYLFSASTILGIFTGLLTAYAMKVLYFGRHSTDREISLMVLMAYLSYVLSEFLDLSGILTIFFCGIIMSHYAWHNVSESSGITTRHAFATMSFVAQTFIFLYVGMDALDIEKWKMTKSRDSLIRGQFEAKVFGEKAICIYILRAHVFVGENFGELWCMLSWDKRYILRTNSSMMVGMQGFWTSIGIYSTIISLILLGRAAFVFPLSALSNYLIGDPENPVLTFRCQLVLWLCGLMRGAVSIALTFNQFTLSGVTRNPLHATMITSTIIVVLFTTVVFSFLAKSIISFLVPCYVQLSEPSSPKPVNTPRSSLTSLLERRANGIHLFWRRFDNSYMRPVFGGQI